MASEFDSKHDIKEDSPPPYLDATNILVLTVDYSSWRRSVAILSPTGHPLFVSHTNSSCSRRLEISNNLGQVIGISKSSLTSKIDVELNDPHQSFEIHNSASVLGGSPGYTSPAFNGEKVIWKNKALSNRIIYTLVDKNGMAVAKFESNPRTQIGKLELTHEAIGKHKMNEIAVTLLTLLHRKMRNIEAAWVAAVT